MCFLKAFFRFLNDLHNILGHFRELKNVYVTRAFEPKQFHSNFFHLFSVNAEEATKLSNKEE